MKTPTPGLTYVRKKVEKGEKKLKLSNSINDEHKRYILFNDVVKGNLSSSNKKNEYVCSVFNVIPLEVTKHYVPKANVL